MSRKVRVQARGHGDAQRRRGQVVLLQLHLSTASHATAPKSSTHATALAAAALAASIARPATRNATAPESSTTRISTLALAAALLAPRPRAHAAPSRSGHRGMVVGAEFWHLVPVRVRAVGREPVVRSGRLGGGAHASRCPNRRLLGRDS